MRLFSAIILITTGKSFCFQILITSEKFNNKTAIYDNFIFSINLIKNKTSCGRYMITDQIDYCVYHASNDWEQFNEKSMCCEIWDSINCIDSQSSICGEREQKTIFSINYAIQITTEEKYCSNYPRSSNSCYLPVWAIVLIVVSITILIIVLTVLFILYKYYRNKKLIQT